MKYFTEEEIEMMSQGYPVSVNLRNLFLNIFNYETYPEVNIGWIYWRANIEHTRLYWKILDVPREYIDGQQKFEDFYGFFKFQIEANKNLGKKKKK